MSQLDKWMVGGKISKLVIVITDKDTGEHVERWQFDVCSSPTLRLQHHDLTKLGTNLRTRQEIEVLKIRPQRTRKRCSSRGCDHSPRKDRN
jgi:hypothetical protein